MRTSKSVFAILGAATLMCACLAGCGDDEPSGTGGGSSSGTPSGSGGDAASGSGGTGNTGGGPDDPYVFDDTAFENYIQTDRHGAVEAGTVGIAAGSGLELCGTPTNCPIGIRDDYNASNPEEDASGMWVAEISNSVSVLHGALDDDLTGLGLTPATLDESLAQAAPVIVPDTIKFNPAMPASYPNGRKLTDQVVDLTVAAALLDLGVHDLNFLAELPLNPAANDVAFKTEFPYLADPH